MKINPINNISFGRVVRLTSLPDSNGNKLTNPQELMRVLKNQHTRLYSREETAKIKGFFAEKLGDYNGKNEIILRKHHEGTNVIISGKDAQDILKLELTKSKKTERIAKKCGLSGKQKQALYSVTMEDVNKEITKRIENGLNQKQYSAFYIKSESGERGKITSVTYEQIKPYFSAEVNGHMLTKQEIKKYPELKTRIAGVEYESETIDL